MRPAVFLIVGATRIDGAATLSYDGQAGPWVRVRLRKPHKCCVSGALLKVGDLAYRPLRNTSYRYERIAAEIVEYSPLAVS